MRVGPQREIGELGRLPGRRLGDLAVAVPDLADEQAGQAVQVPLALLVKDILALAAHDDRHVGVLIGRVPGEVQPHVPLGGFLQRSVVEFWSAVHLVPQ